MKTIKFARFIRNCGGSVQIDPAIIRSDAWRGMTPSEKELMLVCACVADKRGFVAFDPAYVKEAGGLDYMPDYSALVRSGICIEGEEATVSELDLFSGTDSEVAENDAEIIYDAYPRKAAKKPAIAAIMKALMKVSATELLAYTKAYAKSRAGQDENYTPYPATWYNQERYLDKIEAAKPSAQIKDPRSWTDADITDMCRRKFPDWDQSVHPTPQHVLDYKFKLKQMKLSRAS